MKRITLVITILLSSLSSCWLPPKIDPHERRAYNGDIRYNGHIEYTVPQYWHAVAPTNPMRVDEYEINSSDPTKQEKATLAIYVFPGNAGGVDSNIARWTAQFKDDSHRKIGNEEQFSLGNMPITTISISGTYLQAANPMDPNSPKTEVANQQLTAAIVELRDEVWFFKLLGDAGLVEGEKANFNKMIDSFTLKLK